MRQNGFGTKRFKDVHTEQIIGAVETVWCEFVVLDKRPRCTAAVTRGSRFCTMNVWATKCLLSAPCCRKRVLKLAALGYNKFLTKYKETGSIERRAGVGQPTKMTASNVLFFSTMAAAIHTLP